MTFILNEVGNPLKDFVTIETRLWGGGCGGEKKGDQLGGYCSRQARNTNDLDPGGISGSS